MAVLSHDDFGALTSPRPDAPNIRRDLALFRELEHVCHMGDEHRPVEISVLEDKHRPCQKKANPMSSLFKVDFGYRKSRTQSRQFNELVAAIRDARDNGEALRRATNRDFRRLEAEWKVVSKARDEAGMISNLKSRQQLTRRLHDIYEIQMLKIRGRLKVTKR